MEQNLTIHKLTIFNIKITDLTLFLIVFNTAIYNNISIFLSKIQLKEQKAISTGWKNKVCSRDRGW